MAIFHFWLIFYDSDSRRNPCSTDGWTSELRRFCWFQIETLFYSSEISTLYQASAVHNDVRGRRLSRPGIERGRGRPCTATLKFPRTSYDEEQDGDDNVREWRFLRIFWLEFSGLGRGHRRPRHPHPRTSKKSSTISVPDILVPSYSWPRKSSTSDVVPYCGVLI